MELGDRGHQELAASVDRRCTCRCGPLTADVGDATVLDDHGLIGEDCLAIHWDHVDASEDVGRRLRRQEVGDAEGEEEYSGGECWTKHRGLQEGIETATANLRAGEPHRS